jgi:holo-[acyl-carrier protein] synthase
MICIGIDVESINRIQEMTSQYSGGVLNLIFTDFEIHQCELSSKKYLSYTICFCVKEAVGKALGTGLSDINWDDIETAIHKEGLNVILYGSAKRMSLEKNISSWTSQYSYWDNHVLVKVVGF